MKKKTTKETIKKESDVTVNYKATIIVLGRKFESVGLTVAEAISNLKPKNVKGKGILVIERGEIKKERVLMPLVTFRLFNSHGLTKDIVLKQISTLFQGI